MANQQSGRLVAALGWGGRARVLAVVVAGPADEVRRRHELDPPAAKRAAEGVVAACLLAAHIKGEERLTVDIVSEVPAFAFVCDVNGDGTLRARFRPHDVLDLPRFRGMMSVSKSLGPKELYRGVAPVLGETMEAALQRYLGQSQQVDAHVRLLVEQDEAGEVVFASGMLVERLPDADDEAFHAFVRPAIEGDFKALMTGFAFGSLGGEPVDVLGASELRFQCTCSRERVVATLLALGEKEIESILVDPGHAEATCHFCNERYVVDAAELHALLGHAPA